MEPKYVKRKALAGEIGVDPRTLLNWEEREGFPSQYRTPNKQWPIGYKREEVEKWMESCRKRR